MVLWTSKCRYFINTVRKLYVRELLKPSFYKYCTRHTFINTLVPNFQKSHICYNINIIRYKHKKTNTQDELTESDEEDADEWDNEVLDRHTKLLNVKVNSLRADVILKAGLGIARNKIETMFYESRIRVNGRKLMKKSEMLSIGDEIDIVKNNSITNPDFLTVSRVEVLSATEKGDSLAVKLRRNKSLTIENYASENSWKG